MIQCVLLAIENDRLNKIKVDIYEKAVKFKREFDELWA